MSLNYLILINILFLVAKDCLAKSILDKYGCGHPENEWAHILADEKSFCYKAVHSHQSFESADKACSALHKSSHLASFHSSKEFHAIAELLLFPSGVASHFWTGLYRLNETSLPTFNEEFALPYMQLYFTDGSKYNWPIPAHLFNSSNKKPADQPMDSHAFENVLASSELLEEPKYCIQVTSHSGEIELQDQDCDTKLPFVCKRPATLLHSNRLAHLLPNQIRSTTEKAVEITIDFSPNNKHNSSSSKVVTSSTPKISDPTTTDSSTNATEASLGELLSIKTSTAKLATTTTTHNNDSTTSGADENTTQTSTDHTSSTVELTSTDHTITTSSEDSSSSSSTETSSLGVENGQGGEEHHQGEGASLPCFSIATFTWTCVEEEVLMFD